MNKKLLLILTLFISGNLLSRDNRIEQPYQPEIKYYPLVFNFTPLGHRMLQSNHKLASGKTGFRELDQLNEVYGAKVVSYQQLRLKILFNAQFLKSKGITFHDLIAQYRQIKGEGKFWRLRISSGNKVSESVRKIWVYLTPTTTDLFTGDRRAQLFEKQMTSIKNLDELNEIHRGSIAHIFFTGEQANLTIVIEFAQAVHETVLNEYRALKEVAKVESD